MSGFRKLSLHLFFGGSQTQLFNLSSMNTSENTKNGELRRVIVLGTGDSGKSALVHRLVFCVDKKLSQKLSNKKNNSKRFSEDSKMKIMAPVLEEARALLNTVLEHSTSKTKEITELQHQVEGVSYKIQQSQSHPNDSDYNIFIEFTSLIREICSDEEVIAMSKRFYLPLRQSRPRRLFSLNKKLKSLNAAELNSWEPDLNDRLLSLSCTVGSAATVVTDDDGTIEFIDVGGHRAERKKWALVFDRIRSSANSRTVAIFTVSLSDFDAPMFESHTPLKLEDSFETFKVMVANTDFDECNVKTLFLVFTKFDLLKETLEKKSTREYLKDIFGIFVTAEENGTVSEKECSLFCDAIEQKFLSLCDDLIALHDSKFVKVRFLSSLDEASCIDFASDIQNELL